MIHLDHNIIILKLPKIIYLIISMDLLKDKNNLIKLEKNLLINLFMLKNKLRFKRELKNLCVFFLKKNFHSWIRNISKEILDWEILRINIKIVCLIIRKLSKLLPILSKELQVLKENLEDSRNQTLQWRPWFLIAKNWKEFLKKKEDISRNCANHRRKVMLKDSNNWNQ